MRDLPFAPAPEAAARWVGELEALPLKVQAGRLYAVLKALHAVTLPAATRLTLLEVLRPSVFAASEILARDAIRFAASLPEMARNAAKLGALLHHELALGFESALTEATPLAGHRAMASLGWMLVRIVQLGEPPKPSVWRRLCRVYRQGETQGWLSRPVNEPLRGGVMETPEDGFKCALALGALAPAWLDPERVGELFAFLWQQKRRLELSATPVADGWSLDFSCGLGPCRVGSTSSASGGLYLSLRLPAAGQWPPLLARRLRHCLGQVQNEEDYPLTRRVDELWHGWESIVAELRHRCSPAANGWLAVPEFELTPLDHDPSPRPLPEASRVWRRLNALLRWRRDDPGAVLEVERVAIRPGDLVALKCLDETRLAAVVRWIRESPQEARIRIGLDRFGEGVEEVQVLVEGQRPVQAIATAYGESRVLVLPPLRIKPGSQAMIGDRQAQMGRVLEWTERFCAYRWVPG
ncbi:hypothetical protein JCM13664_16960 [Methylothermus subterraneus]